MVLGLPVLAGQPKMVFLTAEARKKVEPAFPDRFGPPRGRRRLGNLSPQLFLPENNSFIDPPSTQATLL